MKTAQHASNDKLPLWQKDLQFERGYNLFLILLSTLGINTKPANFANQMVVSLLTSLIVGFAIALYKFHSSKKNLEKEMEFRLERLSRGRRWRIENNFRVFTVAAIGIATIGFVVHSLFGTVIYSYGQYLLLCLSISAVYGIFFTITSARLDVRAQNLSNS